MPEKAGEVPPDKYSAKVTEIRRLPRHTPEQRQAAREKITEVRHDLKKEQFAVAFAAAFLEPLLVENPYLTADEANALVEAHFSPEARFTALKTIHALRSQADDSRQVLSYFVQCLSPWATDVRSVNAGDLGKAFFRAYAGLEPVGNCALYYEPFGVYLALGEKDFRILDPRKNVGGFYKARGTVKTDSGEYRFPLIVTLGQPSKKEVGQRVLPHERGHGYAAATKIGLERDSVAPLAVQEKHWGGSLADSEVIAKKLDGVIDLAKTAERLNRYPVICLWGRIVEGWARKNFQIWANQLRHQALGEAKDEIISELYAPGGNLDQKAASLKKEGFIYDYLADAGLEKTNGTLLASEAGDLRKSYNAEIDRATAVAKNINSFLADLGFEDSRKATWGLLVPEPIERWSRLYRDNFSAEKIAAYNPFINLRRNTLASWQHLDYIARGLLDFNEPTTARPYGRMASHLKVEMEAISGRLQKSFGAHAGEVPTEESRAEEDNLSQLVAKARPLVDRIPEEENRLRDRLEADLEKTPAFRWRARTEEISQRLSAQRQRVLWTPNLDTPDQKTMARDALTLGRTYQRISELMKSSSGRQLDSWRNRFGKLGKLMEDNRGSIFRTLRAARDFLEPVEIRQLEQLEIDLGPLERRISAEAALVQKILEKYRQ